MQYLIHFHDGPNCRLTALLCSIHGGEHERVSMTSTLHGNILMKVKLVVVMFNFIIMFPPRSSVKQCLHQSISYRKGIFFYFESHSLLRMMGALHCTKLLASSPDFLNLHSLLFVNALLCIMAAQILLHYAQGRKYFDLKMLPLESNLSQDPVLCRNMKHYILGNYCIFSNFSNPSNFLSVMSLLTVSMCI